MNIQRFIDNLSPVIDEAVAVFMPSLAENRMKARIRYEGLKRHYEGASGKRHRDFRRSGASANTNLIHAQENLVSNARQLHDNNATARRGIDIITKYVANIKPHAVTGEGRKSPEHEARLKDFADTVACDPGEKLNLYAQQALTVRTMTRDGEALIEKIVPRDWKRKGLPVPLQTRVLECDYLDKTKISVSNQGNPVFMGVEYDRYGTPLYYHMYDEHPGESRLLKNLKSRKRDARDIIHVFDSVRPGQLRGITRLAPVLIRLRDLDEYEDAQLLKQKISASFVGIIEDIGPENAEDVSRDEQEADFQRLMSEWKPGTILQGIGGKHINFNQTPSVDSFKDTSPEFKRSIAAGLGVPYMALSSDYGSANYTSSRMEFLDFYKEVDHLQENVLIPQACHKQFRWFLEAAELIGLRSEGVRGIWTPPRRELIEPMRDIQAIILQIQSGLMTHAEGVRSLGFDPFDVYDEMSAVMGYLKKKNLKFNFEKKPQLSVEKEDDNAS